MAFSSNLDIYIRREENSQTGEDSGSGSGTGQGTDTGSNTGQNTDTGSNTNTGADSGAGSNTGTGSDNGNGTENAGSDTGIGTNGTHGSEGTNTAQESGNGITPVEVNKDEIVPVVPDTGFNLSRNEILMGGGLIIVSVLLILFLFFLLKIQKIKKEKKSVFTTVGKKAKIITPVFVVGVLGVLGIVFSLSSLSSFAEQECDEENKTCMFSIDVRASEEVGGESETEKKGNIHFVSDTIKVDPSENGSMISFEWENLVSEDGKTIIPSIVKEGELLNKTFGYALEEPNEETDFYPMSKEIFVPASESVLEIPVYYAVRMKSESDVELKGTIGYKVETERSMYMQDYLPDTCNLLEKGREYTFFDRRDDKSYQIVKLGDGNCWMKDELKLSLAEDKELTSEDTDIKEGTYRPGKNTKKMSIEEMASGESDPCGSDGDDCSIGVVFPHTEGYLYTFSVATAGSGAGLTEGEAENSICPKGWHLPNQDEQKNLLYGYSSESKELFSVEKFGLKNYMDERTASVIGFPFYSSSIKSGGVMSVIGKVSGSVDFGQPSENDFPLGFVKCVANQEKLRVIYEAGTDDEVRNLPQIGYYSERNENGKFSVEISEQVPEREGYSFVGWATEEGGIGNYSAGETVELLTTELKLYAVWAKNMGMKMQEFSSGLCSEMNTSEPFKLEDDRDGKIYTIMKMNDGNCWMTSNLDLDLGPEVTLTSEDTDLPEGGSWTSVVATSGDGSVSMADVNGCEKTSAHCTDKSFSMDIAGVDGNLYNLISASAGTVGLDSNAVIKMYGERASICPKGWHLGTIEEYSNLAYGYSLEGEQFKPGKWITGKSGMIPYFTNSFVGVYDALNLNGSGAKYVKSLNLGNGEASGTLFLAYPYNVISIQDQDAFLYGNTNSFNLAGSFETALMAFSTGGSIRCVANNDTNFTLKYDANTTETVTNMPVEEGLSVDHEVGYATFAIPNSDPVREGYLFAGWTKTGDEVYRAGDVVKVTSPTTTLYAKWLKPVSGVTYMQYFDNNVCDDLPYDVPFGLKDARDEKVYSISRLRDGNCWMTSNLALGESQPMNLDSSNTNVNSFVLPGFSSDRLSWDSDSTHEPSVNKIDGNYYYNWSAAVGMTKSDVDGGNVSSSICPRGWGLPTGGKEGGEFKEMIDRYGGSNIGVKKIVSDPLSFNFSGFIDEYGNLSGRGDRNGYWSSTKMYRGSSNAYDFYVYGAGYAYANDDSYKYRGYSVRCILRQ